MATATTSCAHGTRPVFGCDGCIAKVKAAAAEAAFEDAPTGKLTVRWRAEQTARGTVMLDVPWPEGMSADEVAKRHADDIDAMVIDAYEEAGMHAPDDWHWRVA
jgi:hypothetical protein